MLQVVSKIPLYKSFRKISHPKLLPLNLTLNVTYHCFSRCQTCNVWKKTVDELTLDEWTKIFKNIGKNHIYWLILSGGEPFFRKDLPQLCQAAYKYCKPRVINIPSNGFLFEIIPGYVEKILQSCPDSQIVINFSLDGIGEKHDNIRNLKDSFQRMLKSYRAVKKIKNSRLTVGIHTVISKLNHKDIPELYNYIQENLQPDSYITEIAERRVELDTLDLNLVPDEKEYEKAINFLLEQMQNKRTRGFSRLTKALRLNYYRLVKQIIKEKQQVLPCYAGFASGQISADGEVWSCCVRAESMGSLRENNYDFKKIWYSQKANQLRTSIKNKECYCPLASASYTNMIMSPKALLKVTKELLK